MCPAATSEGVTSDRRTSSYRTGGRTFRMLVDLCSFFVRSRGLEWTPHWGLDEDSHTQALLERCRPSVKW